MIEIWMRGPNRSVGLTRSWALLKQRYGLHKHDIPIRCRKKGISQMCITNDNYLHETCLRYTKVHLADSLEARIPLPFFLLLLSFILETFIVSLVGIQISGTREATAKKKNSAATELVSSRISYCTIYPLPQSPRTSNFRWPVFYLGTIKAAYTMNL